MAESELQNVLLQTVGRSHPLLVHFPVALLVVAAVSELGGLWRRSPEVGAMAGGWSGSLSPQLFAAAFAGWTMSERDPVSRAMASTLEWHRWTGVGVLALTLLCVLLRQKTSAFRGVLFCGAIGVAVTGHLGGTMSWGEGYLLEPIQSWRAANAQTEPAPESVVRLGKWSRETSRCCSRSAFWGGLHRSMCLKKRSHGSKILKQIPRPPKSNLSKTSSPSWRRTALNATGHERRKVVFVSNPSTRRSRLGMRISGPCFLEMVKVLLVQRMLLPRDDDEAMPPKGDAVPADEIQKVITWINEGAHGPGLEHIKRVATKAADERRLDPWASWSQPKPSRR